MNDLTRLEEELEKAHYRGRRWGGVALLLLALLLLAGLYIVKLRQGLLLAEERIRALNFKVDTLRLEQETLRLDAARCKDRSGEVSSSDEGVTAERSD